MTEGIGVDLLDISRIKGRLANDAFMKRVFTEQEREYISKRGRMAASSAAGIFCAKEAFVKAAGEGLRIPLNEITVLHEELGRPYISLSGQTQDRFRDADIQLSITHTGSIASAIVTINKRKNIYTERYTLAEMQKLGTDGEIVVSDSFLDENIPRRFDEMHKGDAGKILVIGGSEGFTGAPIFSAEAALRTGAGLVYMSAPDSIYAVQASKCREVMCFPVKSYDGRYSDDAVAKLLDRANSCDAVVLGPGFGRGEESDRVVLSILKDCKKPLVLDADGINAVSEHIDVLCERSNSTVVTPHSVEFTRLGGKVGESGRTAAARELAKRLGITVLLKGHHTVVAEPDGTAYLNTTGNPGMATGGSGDLLSGVIAALLAIGIPAGRAAACGAYIHGLAGDMAAADIGEFGMLPSDMLRYIPQTLKRFGSHE